MTVGEYAHKKQYGEAIERIKDVDDVILILAHAYENEGYEITAETKKVAYLLVDYAMYGSSTSFIAHIAVNISENKNNIATYFMNAEEVFDASITDGENPCIEIYEKLIKKLYAVAIEQSNSAEDEEIIRDYLEYEGYTLEEFVQNYNEEWYVQCWFCKEVYEFSAQTDSIRCKKCGILLENSTDDFSDSTLLRFNQECDAFDEVDSFEEIDDLLEDFDVIENFDDTWDPSEDADDTEFVLDTALSFDEEARDTIIDEDSFKQIDYSLDAYIKEIQNFTITPFNISHSLFEYKIIEPKLLLSRMLYLMSKARREGIFSLQEDILAEPNPFLKYAMRFVINGFEPDTIRGMMQIKQEWFRKKYLQFSLSEKKATFIKRVMMDVDFIIEGVMSLQAGDSPKALFNLHFKDANDFEESHEKYLHYNDPYLLLEGETTNDVKKLLRIFNKKRDALQNIEMCVLEDSIALANRLIKYATIALEYGSLPACWNPSLQDPNPLIRHLFQKILFAYNPCYVKEFATRYKNRALKKAKKYHTEDFILFYEREMEMIISVVIAMMAGEPIYKQKELIRCYYPEITDFYFENGVS